MQTSKDLEPSDLVRETDRLYAVIGLVVVNFQQIELWLAEAVAAVLGMRILEERHIVSAAMSFRQKVDLLVELYPKRKKHPLGVDINTVKKALCAAEEFRNRIVHSLWAVEDSDRWVRIKGSLRGRNGFKLTITNAGIAYLEAAAASLRVVREWELNDEESLILAINLLSSYDDHRSE